MTMYEMNFSLLVEDTLKNIVLPEYRQIIVEVNGPDIGCSFGSQLVFTLLCSSSF